LTTSHANIPLEHATEDSTPESSSSSSSSSSTSSLVGKPVYFEKQSDNPDLNDIRLRIVGGGDSQEQRNYCMHLRWDLFKEEYLFAGCGGALISNCHVLTAAHCSANGRVGLPDGLYCNAWNPFEGNYGEDFHFSNLSRTFVHPEFSSVNNKNDVAILELEECIQDPSLYPVMNVADEAFLDRLMPSENLVVSGFGRLSEDNTAQTEHLQQVQVPYISKGECQTYYPGRIYDDMMCAGNGATGGIDSCQGDSGGALFHQGPGGDTNQTAVGVVSWGVGCAQAGRPGVYSSMAYHRDWIKNIVCNHDRTDTSIPLCAPVAAPTPAPVVQDGIRTTCAALHDTCGQTPCCGNYICKSRTVGAAPTCALAPSNSRSPLSGGRGGAGGASKGGS
jgi:secreted trypsin-like serine protease